MIEHHKGHRAIVNNRLGNMLLRLANGDIAEIRRDAYPSDGAYQMELLRARGLCLQAHDRDVVRELRSALHFSLATTNANAQAERQLNPKR